MVISVIIAQCQDAPRKASPFEPAMNDIQKQVQGYQQHQQIFSQAHAGPGAGQQESQYFIASVA
jgi:hypothetical protein